MSAKIDGLVEWKVELEKEEEDGKRSSKLVPIDTPVSFLHDDGKYYQ